MNTNNLTGSFKNMPTIFYFERGFGSYSLSLAGAGNTDIAKLEGELAALEEGSWGSDCFFPC